MGLDFYDRNFHANGMKKIDGQERAALCTVAHKHIHSDWRKALMLTHLTSPNVGTSASSR